MLRVTGVQEAFETSATISIDAYLPIKFRSRSEPIRGARYIRLGNFKTQLLELQFPAESLTLCGFTLVSGTGVAHALPGEGQSAAGLPVIALPQGENFRTVAGIPRLEIQTDVTLSCSDQYAEVRLGAAKIFNHRVGYGRVQFLLADDVLLGLRVLDLNEQEQRILHDYIARHPNTPD
jgi:hypothetical protein